MQRGFTLIEVVVTVLGVGALAAIAVPRFSGPATLTVKSQAQGVTALVARAREDAMARQQQTRVTVTASAVSYAACASSAVCVNQASLSPAQGVVFSANTLPVTAYFNTQGVPIDALGGNPVTQDRQFAVSYTQPGSNPPKTSSFTVLISALTGRVALNP